MATEQTKKSAALERKLSEKTTECEEIMKQRDEALKVAEGVRNELAAKNREQREEKERKEQEEKERKEREEKEREAMRQLVESEERARKALMPARAFKADGSVELTQTAEQKAALVGSIKRKVASGDYSGTKRNKHAAIEKELRWNHAEARTGLKVKHAEELHEDTFLEHERAVLNKQAAEAVYVAAEAGRITARKAKEAAAGAVSVKKQANNRTALALLGN